MSDVFLSYSSEDKEAVEHIARALDDAGLSVFWAPATPPGANWRDFILRELSGAPCVLVIWSQRSISSLWVLEEAELAKSRGVLLPVLLEAVSPPFGFKSLQCVDLSAWDGSKSDQAFQNLLRAVQRMLMGERLRPTNDRSIGLALPAVILISLILGVGWLIGFTEGAHQVGDVLIALGPVFLASRVVGAARVRKLEQVLLRLLRKARVTSVVAGATTVMFLPVFGLALLIKYVSMVAEPEIAILASVLISWPLVPVWSDLCQKPASFLKSLWARSNIGEAPFWIEDMARGAKFYTTVVFFSAGPLYISFEALRTVAYLVVCIALSPLWAAERIRQRLTPDRPAASDLLAWTLSVSGAVLRVFLG